MVTGECAPRRAEDAGLSLLEVVIAMSIFAVGVTAILGILVNSDDLVGGNIRRTAATNLVNQTLEAARAQTAIAITNGRVVSTQTVGGTTYTITQDAKFLTSNASANVCQSSGSTGLQAGPGLGGLAADGQRPAGHRGCAAGDRGHQQRRAGLQYRHGGGTDHRGHRPSGVRCHGRPFRDHDLAGHRQRRCAVFAGLTPQAYTVTANQSGYVGSANTATATTTISAAAGTVTAGPCSTTPSAPSTSPSTDPPGRWFPQGSRSGSGAPTSPRRVWAPVPVTTSRPA